MPMRDDIRGTVSGEIDVEVQAMMYSSVSSSIITIPQVSTLPPLVRGLLGRLGNAGREGRFRQDDEAPVVGLKS